MDVSKFSPREWANPYIHKDIAQYIHKLKAKNTELRLVLEEYPPEYMMENDQGVFFIYCRACGGKWIHVSEIEEEEPQHDEYCEVQKAIAGLEG